MQHYIYHNPPTCFGVLYTSSGRATRISVQDHLFVYSVVVCGVLRSNMVQQMAIDIVKHVVLSKNTSSPP